jgi:hypothetical protein
VKVEEIGKAIESVRGCNGSIDTCTGCNRQRKEVFDCLTDPSPITHTGLEGMGFKENHGGEMDWMPDDCRTYGVCQRLDGKFVEFDHATGWELRPQPATIGDVAFLLWRLTR